MSEPASEPAVEIRPAATTGEGGTEDMATIRALFLEYQDWLRVDLCFQEIPAYYDNPLDDVRYLELGLSAAARMGA